MYQKVDKSQHHDPRDPRPVPKEPSVLSPSSSGRGKNTKYVNYMVEVAKIGALANKEDVASMQEAFTKYLQLAAEWDMKVGNLAAYSAIGITKEEAYTWSNGNGKGKDPAYRDFILQVRQICGTYREALAMDGAINPVLSIFWQKNYDGLRDETVQTVQAVNALGEDVSAESIMNKYAYLPED